MRLWNQELIPHLPRAQLLGQHRECCALRGLGWGKKHSVVAYVFQYSPFRVWAYHSLVMAEMWRRGYHVGECWVDPSYRGLNCAPWGVEVMEEQINADRIYPEHDESHLADDIDNLASKGVACSVI